MNIQTISIDRINAAAYNPRADLQPGDPEYEKLRRSIEEFGYVEPIVWNERTGNMVGGHQRYKILKERGVTEVAVSVVDLDDQQERLLNLALNKVSGRWDDAELAKLLDELQAAGADLDLSGFEQIEIDELITTLPTNIELETLVTEDDFDVSNVLDKITEPGTKRGDVWGLGRHILVCGDATDSNDVELLMGEAKAALVVTDPPYNVAIKSDSERLSADGRKRILNDDMPVDEFAGFLHAVFERYVSIMDPNAAMYVFHSAWYQREFQDAMESYGISIRSQCVWVKNAASFGWSQYRWQHEPVFYAHIKNKSPSWYGDRKQSTVWEVSRGNVNEYVHPTQKPLPLLSIPIGNSSKPNDIVVDFFGGSGSTLMTCEQMGRECRTLELDPVFCDVIKERFHAATGIEPILLQRAE